MKKYILTPFYLLTVCFLSTAYALDIYVSPTGSDANTGTKNKPLATFGAAQQKARKVAGKEAVTIYFGDGVYYLPQTVVFYSKGFREKKVSNYLSRSK